jgi:hypothetical protein
MKNIYNGMFTKYKVNTCFPSSLEKNLEKTVIPSIDT